MEIDERIEHLLAGNRRYRESSDAALRERTAVHGQHPRAIVVACSDARVIPEEIFDAVLGELFVIRVAGNVLDNHQLGSIEYAAAHLGCPLVIVLGHTRCGAVGAALHGESDGFIRYITDEIAAAGHTRCGAVGAALHGESDGFIRYITDEIAAAIGDERDPLRACEKNVLHAVGRIRHEFAGHPEIENVSVRGAVYDVLDGTVRFVD